VIVLFIGFCPFLGHFNFAEIGLYYFAATSMDFVVVMEGIIDIIKSCN